MNEDWVRWSSGESNPARDALERALERALFHNHTHNHAPNPEVAMEEKLRLCQFCEYHRRTTIFDLCLHSQSVYRVADAKEEFHTVGHMRTRGACGPSAVLMERRVDQTVDVNMPNVSVQT